MNLWKHDPDMVRKFGELFRDNQGCAPTEVQTTIIEAETTIWFQRIPIAINWQVCEPYTDFDGMCNDIAHGRFKMVDYDAKGFVSQVFGKVYSKFRAVHDYFGHFEANNIFGVIGELSAYGVHCGMFSPIVWPLIFNELILVNCYRDHFKESPPDKLVMLP